MGAGAAMGPTEVLLQLGATVVAVDIPSERVWSRLIDLAKRSPGTLIFPVRESAAAGGGAGGGGVVVVGNTTDAALAASAGCDLLKGGHIDVAHWLVGLEPTKPMCIGAYAYVDGVRFILITAAMDAVMEHVRSHRATSVSYAYLCTPTDVHIRPKDARDDAMLRWHARPVAAVRCSTTVRKTVNVLHLVLRCSTRFSCRVLCSTAVFKSADVAVNIDIFFNTCCLQRAIYYMSRSLFYCFLVTFHVTLPCAFTKRTQHNGFFALSLRTHQTHFP